MIKRTRIIQKNLMGWVVFFCLLVSRYSCVSFSRTRTSDVKDKNLSNGIMSAFSVSMTMVKMIFFDSCNGLIFFFGAT